MKDGANGTYSANFIRHERRLKLALGERQRSQRYRDRAHDQRHRQQLARAALTWATPKPITYGTPLGTGQLNASAGGI